MANPNYPNYPPGGGYPSNPYPGAPPGMTQQAAPPPQAMQQQAPTAPPRAPKGPSTLGPPPGPAKMLYIGLVLILVSFTFKQFFVDLSLNSASGMFQVEKIRADQEVEMNDIDSALDEIDSQIDELTAEMPKLPDSKSASSDSMKDMDAFSDKMKKFEEKMDKLKKERSDKDKDLEDKRKDIKKKYRPLIREAGRSADSSRASGLGKIQLTLLLKLLMDLLKIGGAVITVLSGLNIAANSEQTSHMKIFATVMAGVAFLAVIAGGLSTLFS